MLGCFLVTLLRCFLVTLLPCCPVPLLPCYSVTLLLFYLLVTLLPCYSVTLSLCYFVILFPCMTYASKDGTIYVPIHQAPTNLGYCSLVFPCSSTWHGDTGRSVCKTRNRPGTPRNNPETPSGHPTIPWNTPLTDRTPPPPPEPPWYSNGVSRAVQTQQLSPNLENYCFWTILQDFELFLKGFDWKYDR